MPNGNSRISRIGQWQQPVVSVVPDGALTIQIIIKSHRNLYLRLLRAMFARLVRSAVGGALKLWL
jgi:hypothetical protein